MAPISTIVGRNRQSVIWLQIYTPFGVVRGRGVGAQTGLPDLGCDKAVPSGAICGARGWVGGTALAATMLTTLW